MHHSKGVQGSDAGSGWMWTVRPFGVYRDLGSCGHPSVGASTVPAVPYSIGQPGTFPLLGVMCSCPSLMQNWPFKMPLLHGASRLDSISIYLSYAAFISSTLSETPG